MSLNSTNPKKIRKFGLSATIFFGLLSLLGIWKGKFLPVYLFGLLAVIGAGFLLAPGRLAPVYNMWLQAAHFLSRAINFLTLATVFYLVVTPAGLIKRIFNGRPLPLEPDSKIASYWVTRTEPVRPRNLFQQP